MGELHLEILVDRMLQGVWQSRPTVGAPQVAYREAITASGKAGEGRFVRQSGGRGQFGHAEIEIEPLPPEEGQKFEFVNRIQVVAPFQKSSSSRSMQGIRRGDGDVARLPAIELEGDPGRSCWMTESFHDVDSSEVAFKIAGSMAFKDAVQPGRPGSDGADHGSRDHVVPEVYMGDVISDLNSRRGRIENLDTRDGLKIINEPGAVVGHVWLRD